MLQYYWSYNIIHPLRFELLTHLGYHPDESIEFWKKIEIISAGTVEDAKKDKTKKPTLARHSKNLPERIEFIQDLSDEFAKAQRLAKE